MAVMQATSEAYSALKGTCVRGSVGGELSTEHDVQTAEVRDIDGTESIGNLHLI